MTGNTSQGIARPEPAPTHSQHDPTGPFHIIGGQPTAPELRYRLMTNGTALYVKPPKTSPA
ncbi:MULTISPECIES: hypothetical protein [unclassified Rhodococcus (in: high G+C Gram-positive bacteria)]|uniref:hypothetical protein n=1 Tax=unclassified Rhodococcus (in: high G+C Gram-positive bacteria) TaxID=192944 RepID=UPI0005E1C721|nr:MULTISPECIES: hypothetical protein [unclassified Rhodococcus (in: high G+C Gram-positive bacteria)]KJF19136.1 hypothetical protein SZ00_06063 [Rhodococcus sp. AD45]RZL20718.1 MAG: hypothetical protein EOP31_31180 [Rhodococcus sp. (in: high G+C Gram-positive bacteria)]